ncbi:transcription factor ces-2-like [Ornithodoros turicata]|uniref:transcription factor ces-2-like n=1 Tax=Ornithodoros turicata TaxID=34597 RepID=UPI003139140E
MAQRMTQRTQRVRRNEVAREGKESLPVNSSRNAASATAQDMGPVHLLDPHHVVWQSDVEQKCCASENSEDLLERPSSAIDMSLTSRMPPLILPVPKKSVQPIPPECKDDAYWERRKRNNESAKRSRELRRIKEQQTTLRVLYLEQENLQLRTELSMLRSEVDKLRQLLFASKHS